MRLDHLYYFNTICKYDNLTRAAEKISISQPALSNSVRQLESEFGVQLFHRTQIILLVMLTMHSFFVSSVRVRWTSGR